MCLYLVVLKKDTYVRNIIKKDATKIQGYIASHTMIRTRNVIIVMVFPILFQIQGLDYCNINII